MAEAQVEREKRAREVIAGIADADGFPKYAEWIREGGPLDGKLGSWARTNDWEMPTSTIRAMLAFNTEEVERLREALVDITAAGENVLKAMDSYNEQNGTYLGGAPYIVLGRRIASARTALGDTDHG